MLAADAHLHVLPGDLSTALLRLVLLGEAAQPLPVRSYQVALHWNLLFAPVMIRNLMFIVDAG